MKKLLILNLFLIAVTVVAQPKPVYLWKNISGKQKEKTRLYVYQVPEAISKGVGVIVCPGGSYHHLGMPHEGYQVAEWLNSQGITAFVLRYRVGMHGYRHPAMIQDIQRAIQYVREKTPDLKKIGVMGFSAGGHLVTMAGAFFKENYLKAIGIEPEVSLRPDFVVPVYPVVSMQDSLAHLRSRKNLIGESFTKEQFARRMENGQDILDKYYDTYINQFNKVVSIERNIRNVTVRGVPIKGKIDKLEFDGKSVNVVDYKTGDPDKAIPKIKGPSDKLPLGGDYWRQAVFYKILVDNYEQKGWKVISTEFDFIEPDKKKQYRKEKVVISPEDIDTVTNQVTSAWEKIQQREFYTGCGKEDCHWCNFVKTNNLAIALHDIGSDETED